jgi:type IV secretion system protein VirD4
MLHEKMRDIGFFFGTKLHGWRGLWEGKSTYISKPLNKDGHIAVIGGAGTGKSACIAKNVLYTWNAPIFAIDIKGELSEYYYKLRYAEFERITDNPKNKHLTVKDINKIRDLRDYIVFDPTKNDGYGYDPYYLLRTGGEDNLVNNAREIALSIIPLSINAREPFWVQSAQNLLTSAILYYFGIGATFSETMTGIQTTDIQKLIDEILESDNLLAKIYINELQDLDLKTKAGIASEMGTKIKVFATDNYIGGALRDSRDENSKCFNWSDLENKHIFLKLP